MYQPQTACRSMIIALSLPLAWAAAAPANAQSAWEPCAYEGQTCEVPGAATVRFGSDGIYSYRHVNGPIRCSVDMLGDPVRGVAKQCAYRTGHHPFPDDRPPGNWNGGWQGPATLPERGWEKCANENRYCEFRGTREVRFGADGRYAYRTVTGGTECNIRAFGDPAPGVKKSCEVRDGTPWGGHPNRPSEPSDVGNWHFCADEKGVCRPPRGATVRFGTDGRYAYRHRVHGEVACNVQTFGEPFYGERKRCEYSLNAPGAGGWNGWGRMEPGN